MKHTPIFLTFFALMLMLTGCAEKNEEESPLQNNKPVVEEKFNLSITAINLPEDETVTLQVQDKIIHIQGSTPVKTEFEFGSDLRVYPYVLSMPHGRGCVTTRPSYSVTENESMEIVVDCSTHQSNLLESWAYSTIIRTENYLLRKKHDTLSIVDTDHDSFQTLGRQTFPCIGGVLNIVHWKEDKLIVHCSGTGLYMTDVNTWSHSTQNFIKPNLLELEDIHDIRVVGNHIQLNMPESFDRSANNLLSINDNLTFEIIDGDDGKFSLTQSNRTINSFFLLDGKPFLTSEKFALAEVRQDNKNYIGLVDMDYPNSPVSQIIAPSSPRTKIQSLVNNRLVFTEGRVLHIFDLESNEHHSLMPHSTVPTKVVDTGSSIYYLSSTYQLTPKVLGNQIGTDYTDDVSVFSSSRKALYKLDYTTADNEYFVSGMYFSPNEISSFWLHDDEIIVSNSSGMIALNKDLVALPSKPIFRTPYYIGQKISTNGDWLAIAQLDAGFSLHKKQGDTYVQLYKTTDFGKVYDIELEGGFLYIALGEGGVKKLNILNLEAIAVSSSFESQSMAYPMVRDIEVRNSLVAFVGSSNRTYPVTDQKINFVDMATEQASLVKTVDPGYGTATYKQFFFELKSNTHGFYSIYENTNDFVGETSIIEVIPPENIHPSSDWNVSNIVSYKDVNPYLTFDISDSYLAVYRSEHKNFIPDNKLYTYSRIADSGQWRLEETYSSSIKIDKVQLANNTLYLYGDRSISQVDLSKKEIQEATVILSSRASDVELTETGEAIIALDRQGVFKYSMASSTPLESRKLNLINNFTTFDVIDEKVVFSSLKEHYNYHFLSASSYDFSTSQFDAPEHLKTQVKRGTSIEQVFRNFDRLYFIGTSPGSFFEFYFGNNGEFSKEWKYEGRNSIVESLAGNPVLNQSNKLYKLEFHSGEPILQELASAASIYSRLQVAGDYVYEVSTDQFNSNEGSFNLLKFDKNLDITKSIIKPISEEAPFIFDSLAVDDQYIYLLNASYQNEEYRPSIDIWTVEGDHLIQVDSVKLTADHGRKPWINEYLLNIEGYPVLTLDNYHIYFEYNGEELVYKRAAQLGGHSSKSVIHNEKALFRIESGELLEFTNFLN